MQSKKNGGGVKGGGDLGDTRHLTCHQGDQSSATSTDSSTRSSQSAASKLSKIGQRLRDSCRNLRAKHGSGGSGNGPDDYTSILAHNESQKSKHYVPMDFTNREGRIVDFSDLPGHCPTKEGYTYFRRKCMQSNVSGLLTETQDTIHLSQPWFHKGVSRDLSQKILSTHAVDGAFLVRNSSVSGGFVISYYFGGKSHHAQALPDAIDGCVTYSLDDGRTRFFDLLQMVEFYQLNRGTLSHRLTHYVVSKDTAIALGYDVCPTTDTTPANRKGGGGQAQKTNAALAAAKNGTTAPPPPSSASKSAVVTKNDSAGPVSKSVSTTNGVPTGVSSCHQPVSDNDMANPPTSLSASSSANCGPEMEKNPPPPPHPHEHTKMNGSSAAEGNHVTSDSNGSCSDSMNQVKTTKTTQNNNIDTPTITKGSEATNGNSRDKESNSSSSQNSTP